METECDFLAGQQVTLTGLEGKMAVRSVSDL